VITFGQAALFGVGAYAAGMLTVYGVTNAFVAWPLAILVSMLFALAIGSLSLRTRGFQFIMVTLAFAQMVYYFAQSLRNGAATTASPCHNATIWASSRSQITRHSITSCSRCWCSWSLSPTGSSDRSSEW
jgi:ABC-type branched-chain amino acid transport system, permease component